MKIQKTTNGREVKVTFIPETDEEDTIMRSLIVHWKYGNTQDGTFPTLYETILKNNMDIKETSLKYLML